MIRTTILFLVMTLPAIAGEPPSEETKTLALKRAYEMNNNSMVGWGSIDPFGDPVVIRTIPIAPPIPKPSVILEAKLPQPKPIVMDVCSRHGKHRVTTHGGKSWRCK